MPQFINILFHIYIKLNMIRATPRPSIIRSLKLYWQPLVLHTWRNVRRVVAGRCQAEPESVQQIQVQQPPTHAKPEAASAVLGSWWWMDGVSPETCWDSYKYKIKFWYTLASCWIFYMNYIIMHGSTNITVFIWRRMCCAVTDEALIVWFA
jgi:hypothetical protein